MKKTIAYIILTLCLGIASTHANEISKSACQSTMESAYEAYGQNDYQTAVSLYESVLDAGFHSPELYYNLGNAYYRLNELGKAILNYERALKLRPHDKEAQENLALANSKTTDNIEAIPEFFLNRWMRTIENLLPPQGWRIAILIAFSLAGACWVLFRSAKRYGNRKLYFILGCISTLLLIISSGIGASSQYHSTHSNTAIVTVPAITVKSSPESNSIDKFILHEGAKITIKEEVGEWFLIKIADGNKGWIMNNEIEII